MKYHPDAALLPTMTETEFAALVDDIRKNGLREAIKLDHTGEWLVDGRHRDRACPEAGVTPCYERLPQGTDILAYIMSANLHRRHLTVEQRTEIVQEVMRRYPEKSNREIAKITNVSHQTVGRISGGPHGPSEKKIGADGKSYPSSGKINDEQKAAIIASLKANPAGQKEIAEQHGVSIGTVSGIKQRLFRAGALPRPASWAPPHKKHDQPAESPPQPPVDFKTYAAQVAARRAPPFDTLSREERGMGSKEYGAQQHPDWPDGWTNDDVFRAEHGRVQIFTEAQRTQNEVMKRFMEIFKPLRVIRELPDPEELDKLTPQQRDQIETHVERYAPAAIAKLQALFAKAQRHRGRAG
jgi:transposase